MISASSERITDYDVDLFKKLQSFGLPVAVVFTKSDIANEAGMDDMVKRLYPSLTYDESFNDFDSTPFFVSSTEENEELRFEEIDGEYDLPKNSEFATLYFSAGKKDKVNKIDLVGFLLNLDQIEKSDVGIIEVKDIESFVAVKRSLVSTILKHSNLGKIKGKKIRILRS